MHRRLGQPKGANIPCALSDYLRYQPEERIPMMDHECLNAFLNWVAYRQNSRPNENLSCPLTGCTEKDFKSFESYLQHVVACRYLRAGKYRCSDCEREECFLPSGQTQKLVKAHKSGKDSRLRDAVTSFFRQFGRKKCLGPRHELHTDAVYPSGFSGFEALQLADDKRTTKLAYDAPIYFSASTFGSETTVPEICTMYRGSHVPLSGELPAPWIQRSELGAQKSMYLQYELPAGGNHGSVLLRGLNSRLGADFSATLPYLDRSEGLEDKFCAESVPSPFQSSQQWPNSTRESRYSAIASPEPLQFYGAKSHSYYRSSDDASMDTEYINSVQGSNNTSINSSWSAQGHDLLFSDLGLRRHSGSMTPVVPGQANLKLDIPRNLSGNVEELQSHNKTASKQLPSSLRVGYNKSCLLNDHFQIVESLENLWTQQLKTSPELSTRTSHFYSHPAFIGGLMVLRRFFGSGFTASVTTKELFQFIHIAFACAYKSFYEDGRYDWEALYQDILRCSQNITEQRDQDLYTEIAEYLWSAPENVQHHASVYAFEGLDTHLHMSRHLAEDVENDMDLEGSSAGRQERIPFQEAYDRLVSQLEGGIMMRNCRRFLDDVICAEVLERKELSNDLTIAPAISMEGTNDISEMLLEPMLQDQTFEAFHPHVLAIKGRLYEGTLLNVREVEVLLIAKNYLPRVTEQLYQHYVQSIQSYCDAIVAPLGSDWRNRYYATCIDNLEAIHRENATTMGLGEANNVYTPSDGGRVPHWDLQAGLGSGSPTSAVTIASSGSSGTSKSPDSMGTSSTLPLMDSPASSISIESQIYNHAAFKPSMTTDPGPTSAHSQNSNISEKDHTSMTYVLSPVSSTRTSPGTAIAPSPVSSNCTTASLQQDNKAHCEWCSKSFSGTRQHRESNLKRHMNDVHQQGSRLICSEPGCGKKCGRADNLRNHRLKMHGIDDPRSRPSNPRRLRKSTRRRMGTPPASTRPETHKPSLW